MTQGKGGGPKTAAGKARSSRNATKHGIISPHSAIIEGMETVEEWEEFCDGIVESLEPVGKLEEEFAQTIAETLWRKRRVTRYETGAINYQVHSAEADSYKANYYSASDKDHVEEPDPIVVAIHQQERVIPKHDTLDNVTRYEAHLHRVVIQTLHEFQALQALRRGERPHLARIDIIAPPRGTAATQPKLDIPDYLRDDNS